jgi:amino acid transporter
VTAVPASGQAAFKQTVKPLQLFTLGFGAIVGAAWIIAVGQWISQAGPLGAAVGLVAGAAILAVISLCYAELGARYPEAGGEVVYARMLCGPHFSYYTGLLLVFTYVATCAFDAISLGWLIRALVPTAHMQPLYRVLGAEVNVVDLSVGAIAVIGAAVTNYRGVRSTTLVQDGLTAALIVTALALGVAGVLGGRIENLHPAFVLDGNGSAFRGIAAVFIAAPFWLSGFGVVSQALGEKSGETQRRSLAVVMLAAIGTACFMYLLMLVAVTMAVPRRELSTMSLPAAGALVHALHSTMAADLVLATGCLGLLIALNAVFYSATRVIYSLGQHREIPSGFAAIHPKYGSPTVAVIFVGSTAFLASVLGRGAILPLVDSTAIMLSVVYVIVCWGLLRLRMSHRRESRGRSGLAIPTMGFVSAVFMTVTAVVTPMVFSMQGASIEFLLILGALGLGSIVRSKQRAA